MIFWYYQKITIWERILCDIYQKITIWERILCDIKIKGLNRIVLPVMPTNKIYIYFFLFDSVLNPFQDYFSSYETGQSVGGAKTGEPREKPPGTPASRTWLVSHVVRGGGGLEPAPVIKKQRS